MSLKTKGEWEEVGQRVCEGQGPAETKASGQGWAMKASVEEGFAKTTRHSRGPECDVSLAFWLQSDHGAGHPCEL